MHDKRKEAYEYIRDVANIRCESDEEGIALLAKMLGGGPELKDEIKLLRDGISGPTERLIQVFRSSFPKVPETVIEAKLVGPFLSEPLD
jgi:hypothetical protein